MNTVYTFVVKLTSADPASFVNLLVVESPCSLGLSERCRVGGLCVCTQVVTALVELSGRDEGEVKKQVSSISTRHLHVYCCHI